MSRTILRVCISWLCVSLPSTYHIVCLFVVLFSWNNVTAMTVLSNGHVCTVVQIRMLFLDSASDLIVQVFLVFLFGIASTNHV